MHLDVYLARRHDKPAWNLGIAANFIKPAAYAAFALGAIAIIGIVIGQIFLYSTKHDLDRFINRRPRGWKGEGLQSPLLLSEWRAELAHIEATIEFWWYVGLWVAFATFIVLPALVALSHVLQRRFMKQGRLVHLDKSFHQQWDEIVQSREDELKALPMVVPVWLEVVYLYLEFHVAEQFAAWDRIRKSPLTQQDTQDQIRTHLRRGMSDFVQRVIDLERARQDETIVQTRVHNDLLIEELNLPSPGMPTVKDS